MTEFVEVMRQKKRMCKAMGETCLGCDFYKIGRTTAPRCLEVIVNNPERAETIIMDWAAEHPVKTLKDVLLEKFPGAKIEPDGVPYVCAEYLGLGDCIGNCKMHWCSPAQEE